MRKFISVLVFAAVAAFPAAALGGEGLSGFRCTNPCPLAKRASTRRATGTEAARASVRVRQDVARAVARNLERI